MLKLIYWLIKWIIVGGDIDVNVDFSLSMTFNEAFEYLKKGYFIYDDSDQIHKKKLFVMINDDIYCIDTSKNSTGYKVTGFTSSAMTIHLWKVVPLGKQINLDNVGLNDYS